MRFSHNQEKALLAAVKSYRTWVYQVVKDSKVDLSDDSHAYFSDLFKTLSDAQKIIQDAVEERHTHKEASQPSGLAPAVATASNNTEEKNWPPINEARVLICDDDELSLELLAIMLENIGFGSVSMAKNGQEAIAKVVDYEEHYDLIICDWKMPVTSGLDVHKEAQAANKLDNTYFILITAIEDDILKSKSIRQGINDYIVKPVEEYELQEKLRIIFPET